MGRSPCCEKKHTNKGAWTKEEDQCLINYIMRNGEGNWRILPKAAGLLRCGKSCRLRWINYLRPDLKRGNFTEEEDELIIKLHSLLGNRWSVIAARLPGRTGNEIKNYWNTHIKRKLISKGIDPQTHRPFNSTAAAPKSTCLDLDFRNSTPQPSKQHRTTSINEPAAKNIYIPATGNSSSVDDTKCNSSTTEEEHDLSTVLELQGWDEEYTDAGEIDLVTSAVAEGNQCTIPDANLEKEAEETSRRIEKGKTRTGLRITLDDLEGQFGEKREDAAKNLSVSISTFKRACRFHNIHRWPSGKKHRKNPSLYMTKNANAYDGDPQQITGPPSSLRLPLEENVPPTNAESNQDLTIVPATDPVIIKAKYEDNIVKFRFCLSSGLVNLAKEVGTRLNLEMGSFKLKYVDEDNDHISLTCDADLQFHVESAKVARKNCISVFVQLMG